MHLAAVLNSQWSRRAPVPAADSAPVGGCFGRLSRLSSGVRAASWGVRLELCTGKAHVWCLVASVVCLAVLCIGIFEGTRLTTHVLRSPCTIVGTEVVDVGTCTLCDDDEMPACEAHPIATARMAVTFKHAHSKENITGWVWYCKGHASMDPCQRQPHHSEQLSLEAQTRGLAAAPQGPVPCTVGEVFAYMQMNGAEGEHRHCYYSSRDREGQDVWLNMPSPGLVDHVWYEKHFEYPALLALGGLVLLSVLLSCLALEGAELWASGLVG